MSETHLHRRDCELPNHLSKLQLNLNLQYVKHK